MKDLQITIKQNISLEHFKEIIISAMEGGSNHWYSIHHKDFENFKIKGKTMVESIAITLFENSAFSLPVYDVEAADNGDDELLGNVTQGSLLNGLEILYKDYHNHFHDLMEGQSDAETADIIFQLAVMGELVFG